MSAIRVTLSDKPTTLFRLQDADAAFAVRGMRVGARACAVNVRDRVRSNDARRHRGAISRRAEDARRAAFVSIAPTPRKPSATRGRRAIAIGAHGVRLID